MSQSAERSNPSARRPSRRDVLRLGAASAAGALGLTAGAATTAPTPTTLRTNRPATRLRPRNVIFMVSDGMSAGVPSLAEPFSRLARDRGTWWNELARRVETTLGWIETASLDSMVTDSAAASSAWATGARCFNGAINMLPDGRKLVPIGTLAKATGRRVGLVTTTRITHATPAGFASVVPVRDMEDDIASQYLGEVDVLLGGGVTKFTASTRRDGRDLLGEYRDRGYAICRERAELNASKARHRLLGLFTDEHFPYSIDRAASDALKARVPTIAEMTRAALTSLAPHDGGFLLQVEGGRVDHAAHANDGPGLLWDQLAFDDALGVALEFLSEHPDTLLIVTSDHGNGNPGLNGMGVRYSSSTESFARLARARASHAAMLTSFRAARTASERDGGAQRLSQEQVRAVTLSGTGLEILDEEAEQIAAIINGESTCEIFRQHANVYGLLGQATGNQSGIGWTGITHTSDLVMLTATGTGRERFSGTLHITDIYDRLADLMGITHRNPNLTPDEAATFLQRGHELRPDGH